MDRFSAIFERAKGYCKTSAELVHLHEATECAKWLCEREGGDPAVVLPAIMLHDIGWSRFSAAEQVDARGSSIDANAAHHRHEEEGAALARDVLEQLDYDPVLIDQIVEMIRWHDSRNDAQSQNEAIVKDGNALSRFTPAGFDATCTRFGMTEAELSKALHDSVDRCFLTNTARVAARLHLSKRRLRSSRNMALSGGLIDRLLELFLGLGDRVLVKAQKALEEIAIEALRQRLMDIKRQIEVYLQCHPDATIDALQQDVDFQALAMQRFHTEGYMGIIDIRRDSPRYGQVIFHPDPRMVNQPIEELEKQRPRNVVHSFWDWYWRAVEGEEFHAYYRSKDQNDKTREKVQWVSPLRVGAFEWSLVASAYVDQSFHHANALAAEISNSIDVMLDELDTNMLLPLSRLIAESELISEGDLSRRVQVDVDNELTLLGGAFNKMVQSIQDSKEQMQDYTRELETQRDELRKSIEIIKEQQASIAALSVPVIRIWEHVLVLPLVGTIDEIRGQHIAETILPRVVAERARHVFIDVTGISVTGPEVVDTLAKITQAIGLLGAACTITGISPQVSRSLVDAQVELRGVRTAMNLEHGLRRVLDARNAAKSSR